MSSDQDTKLDEFKSYYDNNQLEDHKFYKNGKLEGKSRQWYKNGQMLIKCFYRDGKMEGGCEWWYEDGKPMDRKFCLNDWANGERKIWFDDGSLMGHEFYRNGSCLFDRDDNFPLLKIGLLRYKYRLYRQSISGNKNIKLKDFIIPDLSNIILKF